jgi:hypothetical protein
LETIKPGLFGIKYSNRDFELVETWGKNQFNSSFPVSLAAYLSHKNFENIYIKLGSDQKIVHDKISTAKLYGMDPNSENLYYSFETPFTPYQQLLIGNIPRIDVVIQNRDNGVSVKGLEIKLTAIPDNSTCNLNEDGYGSEIVIRPDTIVYLACSIAILYKEKTEKLFSIIGDEFESIKDWAEPQNIIPYIPKIFNIINKISLETIEIQEPLVMQPIWKTEGKSPILSENCLDIFIWSNLAFTRLFLDAAKNEISAHRITRQIRTIIWLFRMLYDFSKNKKFNHRQIIDNLSYNTKNDKAFAVNGKVTQPYMTSDILKKPRIKKGQIKEIILGNGQKLLSPERRFDAIIFNSPDLFD